MVGLLSEVALFPKSFRMVEFINRSMKEPSKRFNCNQFHTLIFIVNDCLVEIVQKIEQIRDQFKKKYAAKFQFIINNYGFMYSRLDSCQALFSLVSKD